MKASIERLTRFDNVLANAYGLDGPCLIFNAWPAARVGNEPPLGEYWVYNDFKSALLGLLP